MKALVVPRGYSWAFTIRPNDLREDRLPRDITEGIHWLVSTRYVIMYLYCIGAWIQSKFFGCQQGFLFSENKIS